MKNVRRRKLTFDSLEQVEPDIRMLLAGHLAVGNWSLAQICKHLADSFVGSIRGFDLRNHRWKRTFFRRPMLRFTLRNGIPENYMVDPNLTPKPEIAMDDSVQMLRAAIERYVQHTGQLHAHPLFGKMPREVWTRIHCIHSAHHLSFAVPSRIKSASDNG